MPEDSGAERESICFVCVCECVRAHQVKSEQHLRRGNLLGYRKASEGGRVERG